ncbi:MAG: glycoside hydrolase family 127 protein [Bacteroidales bacterium]|nr:glycoside hydrolase family 127 protein [Bacteroidales bacterium]
MKTIASTLLLFVSMFHLYGQNQPLQEKYQRLPFGSIKPTGWLKTQMEKDLQGFVGNLGKLIPDLVEDPIYGEGRLHKNSSVKELGNLKEGDVGGDEQYKWWNSETQSNWWDGYIRYALLLDDQQAKQNVQAYIDKILSTQDEDGYLGIYDKELRYQFTGENGELWSKATLHRGLLAYYECTQDRRVWDALIRAVDDVIRNYPKDKSQPFFAGTDFSGGVAHGLTFTDVLDRMYQLTGDRKYSEYAAFLYFNFSENHSSEKDAQLRNILDPNYKLQSHGVHTYEHMRPLTVAAYATGKPQLQQALQIYRQRIADCTTPSGGAVGDEWIAGRHADATHTGYEYCSLHELLDSYSVLFQKSGDISAAEVMETIFYNASQGSRNPEHSCIAYLKTDNSYEMMGTKNGEKEAGRNQTRYKYSAVHQDVAACCVPNAGRISPYFLQSCWLKEDEHTLVAAVLAPNTLQTKVAGIPVSIDEITGYPYENRVQFRIKVEKPTLLRLKIKKPLWAETLITKEKYVIEEGFIVIERLFAENEEVEIEFPAEVRVTEDLNHEKYFSYGALVYALPIPGNEIKGKIYAPGFEDLYYTPGDQSRYAYIEGHEATYKDGKIIINLKNLNTQKIEKLEMIPLGKTILRQASFAAKP